ncbi:hypothetical protein [Rhodoblastus sp.]|uniref:hypothetical protein n=1 Tax=Rhodoblastus sp. TaxID=1962975 RepID=UPI003F9EA4C6
MTAETDKAALRVLAVQGEALDRNLAKAEATAKTADAAIENAERLLASVGQPLPVRKASAGTSLPMRTPRLRTWDEIAAEARVMQPEKVSFADILSPADVAAATGNLSRWKEEFSGLHRLTQFDYAVAGAAGLFAGLADILLVQVPRHPGFLGSSAAEGGWLSNVIKEKFGDLLPDDTIRELERDYKVPYDPSTSQRLDVKVEGLGPRTHRMSSLGHDPVLGWFFGVRDIITGSFSAIGSDGRLVIQSVAGWEPTEYGVGLFVKILEAFQSVAGHMLSDVATKAGLPPPLFGLLQFLQMGGIGDHSIADIARGMYRRGYDLRHFLAGGVTVMIVEVFVRTAWTVRELSEGKSLMDALPVSSRRLQSGLFLSHTVATAINAGKVAVMQNPLSLNWAQWLMFFRYVLPQAHWLLVGRPEAKAAFVREKLEASWGGLDADLTTVWADAFGSEYRAIL